MVKMNGDGMKEQRGRMPGLEGLASLVIGLLAAKCVGFE